MFPEVAGSAAVGPADFTKSESIMRPRRRQQPDALAPPARLRRPPARAASPQRDHAPAPTARSPT
ncbi:hypothetical protein, partial [Micromonospora foliorum]|uniref:hypothetical protein n=1 Tax=Micromonospora foliorum TaxID=2911210 RepID=UPI001EE9670F